MGSDTIIKRAAHNEMPDCYRIRRHVFIEEQNVPEELECDSYDDEALHFIALNDAKPVATARAVLKDGGKTAKIGRVAVIKPFRGKGIGKLLMITMEKSPELRDVTAFVVDSQTHALAFYRKLGYVSYGEEFMDAGMPHFHMRKNRESAE
ncbi:MAG: GNAT family N-acetyltransferase [Bdellovibrionales bacterium]